MSAIQSRAASAASAASRGQSAPGSRTSTATTRASAKSSAKSTRSRTATAKSRTSSMSARSSDRAVTARALERLLSGRPRSSKSVAWSDGGEKTAKATPEEPTGLTAAGDLALSKELEEELNRDEVADREDAPQGCWAIFTKFISSLWDTTEMKPGEEREVIVRTSLRELIIYIVFLAILCIVTLSAMSPTMYQYTAMVKKLFGPYQDVKMVDDFWEYMENDLLDGLYWEEWYNEGDDSANFPCPGHPDTTGPCPIDTNMRMIMHANRLLGVPRVRQLRVTNKSCSIPEQFKEIIQVCYGPYSSDIEDEQSFSPNYREYTSADAWRYQSVKELVGTDHWGQLATYSGAGSIQNLREKRNDSLALIKELKEGLWIGRGTRYISIDFTIYNANINLFCVVKLDFEFPPTGGIKPTGNFGTVKLLRYITRLEYGIMGAEFVFAAFIFYYMIEEILELRSMRLAYFASFWNWLDIFVLTVSIATLTFNVYTMIRVSTLLKSLLAEPELFKDFSYLEKWSKTFQNAAALTIFAGFLKIFKYISFNKTMSQLAGTIQRCAGDVAAFSLMFYIVFIAYAQIGYLMFGANVRVFSTIYDCLFTQFRLLLGDFNFPDLQAANRIWGPVYFLSYVFIVFFVLMNMFLAIINDTYSEVKEEVDNRREEFQVGDYVMRGYNNIREMILERDKLIDIKETVKLAGDDGVVTYDEIRESLRKLNFSDLEIEIFCSRYDKDGDFTFNADEINAINQGLGDQIANYDHLVLNEENDEQEEEEPAEKIPKMNKTQFGEMESRVNHMESQMVFVVNKVEQVLSRLEEN